MINKRLLQEGRPRERLILQAIHELPSRVPVFQVLASLSEIGLDGFAFVPEDFL